MPLFPFILFLFAIGFFKKKCLFFQGNKLGVVNPGDFSGHAGSRLKVLSPEPAQETSGLTIPYNWVQDIVIKLRIFSRYYRNIEIWTLHIICFVWLVHEPVLQVRVTDSLVSPQLLEGFWGIIDQGFQVILQPEFFLESTQVVEERGAVVIESISADPTFGDPGVTQRVLSITQFVLGLTWTVMFASQCVNWRMRDISSTWKVGHTISSNYL